jgi:HK97 family phage portal protein
MAITGEEWSSNVVGNGGKPTGVLMYDKILTKEQREQLRDRFRDLREGPTDALMTLEAGMKYEQISLSPQDVQLLEARRFQIEDIARFFGVPSVMINDTAGGTVWGSGIQQIIEGWYKLALRTELERIEASIVSNLLAVGEREPDQRRVRLRRAASQFFRRPGRNWIEGSQQRPDDAKRMAAARMATRRCRCRYADRRRKSRANHQPRGGPRWRRQRDMTYA